MSVINYKNRIECLLKWENMLDLKEKQISKMTAQYYRDLAIVEEKIKNIRNNANTKEMEVEKIRNVNVNLQKALQKEEKFLEAVNKKHEELTLQLNQLSLSQSKHRHRVLQKKLKWFLFKNVTKIHINNNALPERVQGAIVCEGGASMKLIPFCFEASKFDNNELEKKLWEKIASSIEYLGSNISICPKKRIYAIEDDIINSYSGLFKD